ncbi:peroxiredoxin [Kamptonema cortianum]|nr:peroxiredoxin [Geitlerinema splendidum]MDK3158586.1 peroxiredoxin [Kamptonema cortianum]
MATLQAGDTFPDFSLEDQNGNTHSKKDLAGKSFVVFCYPKDDTSGCTVEACEFRDAHADFGEIPVFGVSPDPVKSHKKFETKFELTYPLLADVEKSLLEPLGVWVEKSMYGKKYMGVERTTFLVGPDGKIVQVWNKVTPAGHAVEVLKAATSK